MQISAVFVSVSEYKYVFLMNTNVQVILIKDIPTGALGLDSFLFKIKKCRIFLRPTIRILP